MNAQLTLERRLFAILDEAADAGASLDDVLNRVKSALFPRARSLRVYRHENQQAVVIAATQRGINIPLDQPSPHLNAVNTHQMAHDRTGNLWVAPLEANGEVAGLLEIVLDPLESRFGESRNETQDALRLFASALQLRYFSVAAPVIKPIAESEQDRLLEPVTPSVYPAFGFMRALYDASVEIASATDGVEALRAIYGFIGDTFSNLRLMQFENDRSSLRLLAEAGPSGVQAGNGVVRLSEVPAHDALIALEARVVADISHEASIAVDERAHLVTQEIGAFVSIPLLLARRLTGVLLLTNPTPQSMPDEMLLGLQQLAGEIALVLENRALVPALRSAASQMSRQVQLLESVNTLATAINTAQDENQLLDESIRIITSTLNVNHGGLMMIDVEQMRSMVVSEYPARGAVGLQLDLVGSDLFGLVMAHPEEPVVINNTEYDSRLSPESLAVPRSIGVRAMLIAPLLVQKQVVGSIGLDILDERQFTPAMVEVAQTMCNQVSLALQNIRLRDDAQRRAGYSLTTILLICSTSIIIKPP